MAVKSCFLRREYMLVGKSTLVVLDLGLKLSIVALGLSVTGREDKHSAGDQARNGVEVNEEEREISESFEKRGCHRLLLTVIESSAGTGRTGRSRKMSQGSIQLSS